MGLPYISHFKIIQSGLHFDTYQYKEPVGYDLESDKKRRGKEVTRRKEPKLHASSLWRSRTNVIRLVDCNAWTYVDALGNTIDPLFITLTFKENLQDVDEANKLFTAFIKRLNYHCFNHKRLLIKYIAIIEFQKRGAVHYHAIFFNLENLNEEEERETREVGQVWGHGFVDVQSVKNVRSLGRYLGKYMGKDHTDLRLLGKKRYFCSRGLKRPIQITREVRAKNILIALMEMCERKPDYENIYSTKYKSAIRYRSFKVTEEELEEINNMYNTKI